MASTTVFYSGMKARHTYRIPSLLVLERGTLMAFCEGRANDKKDYGDIKLMVSSSYDGGKTWTEQQILHKEGCGKQIRVGNPCAVEDTASSSILLFFTCGENTLMLVRSEDRGCTWTSPRSLHRGLPWLNRFDRCNAGPGVGIQIRQNAHEGRIVVPCYGRTDSGGETYVHYSFVLYSDDYGSTWRHSDLIGPHSGECQVAELEDGRLLMNMRNQRQQEDGGPRKVRAVAESTDGGGYVVLSAI
jgi:sialidase-1